MTTHPPPERLARFDRAERAVHWANAVLFGVLIATGAALYIGPLAAAVGRRDLVRDIHVIAGVVLPLPLLLGLLAPGFRTDVSRLNRFDDHDRRWLASLGADPGVRIAKFHPGQKLNAAFTAGAVFVMLATGSVMRWFAPFPLSWRQGATFVHDWLSVVIVAVVLAHTYKALRDRHAMAGMVRGTVPASWAERHHPRWFEDAQQQ